MATKDAPNLHRLSVINTDGSRKHPQPADVNGRFLRARRIVYAVLIAIYVAMPFVHVDGRPAVQLDVAARRFYLFGSVFNAQDFWRAVFLLLLLGTAILFVTTWLGRVWCGWACPQTVFLEGVYRRIERFIEGPREKRIRLDKAPWGASKAAKKVAKHAAFLVVSLVLANVALAFFVSLPTTFEMVRHSPTENWTAFLWVATFTAILYFNFAWFREQLCIVICPYGRLQSALIDRHTLVIGYDTARGEPRGKLSKKLPVVQPAAAEKKGDCVDCNRCVVVCPTGIDIRHGLQLECIGCAQCIDACDEVMTKVGRPTGLIRYDSMAGLDGEKRQVVRPRLLVYAGLATAAAVALVAVTVSRTPFEANLLRVRGAPYVLEAGKVRNQYELHLVNKNPEPTTFRVSVEADDVPIEVTIAAREVRVESLDHFRLPVFVSVKDSDYRGPFEIEIEVHDSASKQEREIKGRFLGPAAALTH